MDKDTHIFKRIEEAIVRMDDNKSYTTEGIIFTPFNIDGYIVIALKFDEAVAETLIDCKCAFDLEVTKWEDGKIPTPKQRPRKHLPPCF